MAAAGQPHAEWRSGFERTLREKLDAKGIKHKYEPFTVTLELEVPGHKCLDCGSHAVGRTSRYTPDFLLERTGMVVEAKGKFTAKDRKRVLAYHKQFGNDKFALLFMRNNRLTKSSKTTYTTWAESKGIPSAVGWFNEEWL
jgi:hypothetical protein